MLWDTINSMTLSCKCYHLSHLGSIRGFRGFTEIVENVTPGQTYFTLSGKHTYNFGTISTCDGTKSNKSSLGIHQGIKKKTWSHNHEMMKKIDILANFKKYT